MGSGCGSRNIDVERLENWMVYYKWKIWEVEEKVEGMGRVEGVEGAESVENVNRSLTPIF